MSEAMLPPLILELRAKAGQAIAEMKQVGREAESVGRKSEQGASRSHAAFNKLAGVGRAAVLGIGAGAAVVGAEALHLGVDFQTSTTQLVTGAGESEAAIGKVRTGLLNLAPAVGETPVELSQGMYSIESAGYHGAAGLNVLKAAAEGAKIGGADMTVVSDGLTTAMNDYHFSAGQAATVTSKLVATVGAGKTTMGDLSGALAHVLPFASSLHIGFNNIMGAMATMTGQGIHAADASTYLKFAMMSLANETPKGAKALHLVGSSATKVHDMLAKRGLSGTLAMITEQVGKKFPVGSAKYTAAISAIVGGTRGMAATLALTGDHLKTYQDNIKSIGDASTEAGGHVKGWSDTQKDLGTQIAQAKAGLEALGTKLGMWLIPKVEQVIKLTTEVVNWFEHHKAATIALAAVIGGVLVVAIGAWIVSLLTATATIGTMEIALAPLVLLIAAIGIAVYELATHWSQIWGAIEGVAVGVWHWAVDIFHNKITQIIIGIVAPMLFVALHWKRIWGDIKSVVGGVVSWVKSAVGSFVGFFTALPGRIAGVAGAMLHAGGALASGIWNGLKSIISDAAGLGRSLYDAVASTLNNDLIDPIKNWKFTIGAFGIHHTFQPFGGIPDIPLLAGGGMTLGPTLAVLGDNRSGNELVMPMDSPRSVRMLSSAMQEAQVGGHGGGGGQVTELVIHNVTTLDGRVVQKSVERHQLRQGLRRGGARTWQEFSKGNA